MESIDLSLNTEKTRPVKAEECFDFLGFRFVRKCQMEEEEGNQMVPIPKARDENKGGKIHSLTGNRARALMTSEKAKELLIPLLRGWSNYFAHSPASKVLGEIWEYTQNRLIYRYCRQHNYQETGKAQPLRNTGPT